MIGQRRATPRPGNGPRNEEEGGSLAGRDWREPTHLEQSDLTGKPLGHGDSVVVGGG